MSPGLVVLLTFVAAIGGALSMLGTIIIMDSRRDRWYGVAFVVLGLAIVAVPALRFAGVITA